MERKINIIIPPKPIFGDTFYNVNEELHYTFNGEQWVEGTVKDLIIGIDLAHKKDQ